MKRTPQEWEAYIQSATSLKALAERLTAYDDAVDTAWGQRDEEEYGRLLSARLDPLPKWGKEPVQTRGVQSYDEGRVLRFIPRDRPLPPGTKSRWLIEPRDETPWWW
ncbi:hypothetical protein [Archangium lansingense]|uniref:Uncharacterized protein n=1 Tax=Archangium lansingense TaxID=2995310 RepID=A0ABT4A841_9BACT|nr:hypothetical protein [Archangium lansinium]MCY1077825.1 hypothetical protein [Archangium lansinium]